jgi:hypothetical protein
MRTVVLAALGLLIATPPISAQEQPPTTWATKLFREENGKIPNGHNFGTVPKGAMLQHRFPITNIYAVPLSITCRVSCTCVTVTPMTQILQPKESAVIDISMDTLRFNGQKEVTVTVDVRHYDQRPQFWSDATLTIRGFCRGDVDLAPAQAVFGIVPVGQQGARELQVRYHGAQAGWQITGPAQNQTLPVDVGYQEAFRQGTQAVYKVTLALKPNAPAGSYKGDVLLATNDPNNPTVAVPYDLTVQAALTVSPEIARMGNVKAGAPAERRVFVRGNQPFHILGVDGQGEGVTAEYRADAATPTHVLTIKVVPGQAGPIQKSLTIRTDMGGATATLKIDATAIP